MRPSELDVGLRVDPPPALVTARREQATLLHVEQGVGRDFDAACGLPSGPCPLMPKEARRARRPALQGDPTAPRRSRDVSAPRWPRSPAFECRGHRLRAPQNVEPHRADALRADLRLDLTIRALSFRLATWACAHRYPLPTTSRQAQSVRGRKTRSHPVRLEKRPEPGLLTQRSASRIRTRLRSAIPLARRCSRIP